MCIDLEEGTVLYRSCFLEFASFLHFLELCRFLISSSPSESMYPLFHSNVYLLMPSNAKCDSFVPFTCNTLIPIDSIVFISKAFIEALLNAFVQLQGVVCIYSFLFIGERNIIFDKVNMLKLIPLSIPLCIVWFNY